MSDCLVFALETSCDETAAAIVRNGREVLGHVVFTQIAQHRPYGGVVPEIACRAHVEALPEIMRDCLAQAGVGWNAIDRIAVTRGPGLASSLLVGVSAAKSLALRLGKPLYGVNHLEGHVYSLFLGDDAPDPETSCPMLVLLVSGGHSCLVLMRSVGDYELLGQTLDDAAGEALDKGAKLLGLGYPGGPEIERAAAGGNGKAIPFPKGRPRASARTGSFDPDLCFSFSGLKTALLTHMKQDDPGSVADIAASYQHAVVAALERQLLTALDRHPVTSVGCVGGVAKNRELRAALDGAVNKAGVPLHLAAMTYCTDNAAMIAGVASSAAWRNREPDASFDIKPSWPLSQLAGL